MKTRLWHATYYLYLHSAAILFCFAPCMHKTLRGHGHGHGMVTAVGVRTFAAWQAGRLGTFPRAFAVRPMPVPAWLLSDMVSLWFITRELSLQLFSTPRHPSALSLSSPSSSPVSQQAGTHGWLPSPYLLHKTWLCLSKCLCARLPFPSHGMLFAFFSQHLSKTWRAGPSWEWFAHTCYLA